MEHVIKIVGAIVVIALIYATCAALFAFPVKWLWNWLIPSVFHLREITALEAWGLMTLSGMLFKSNSKEK